MVCQRLSTFKMSDMNKTPANLKGAASKIGPKFFFCVAVSCWRTCSTHIISSHQKAFGDPKWIDTFFFGYHYLGVSQNGGTQQPWVFLLKIIILGCFGGTTIYGNTHLQKPVAVHFHPQTLPQLPAKRKGTLCTLVQKSG